MKKKAKNIAESMLIDYPHIDAYISQRIEELTYPVTESDDNVGGGKGSVISKPQERLVITIDEDKRIEALEREKEAVMSALDGCDDITISIIEQYFWKSKREKTMDGISIEVHLSKRAIYKRLNKLYENILHNYGLEFI